MPRKKSNTTDDESTETDKGKKKVVKKEKKVKETEVKEEIEKKEKKVKPTKVKDEKVTKSKSKSIKKEIIVDSPNKKINNDEESKCIEIELDEECKENNYDKKFNKLKESYVKICKETSEIQMKLNEKDKERENILKQIRQIQIDYLPSTNFGVILGSKLITDENKKVTEKVNNSINIKKPIKKSDMETDDSNSEYSDDIPFSDGESD